MFSDWSREFIYSEEVIQGGKALTFHKILRFREGAPRNEKLSAEGAAVYDRVHQLSVVAVGQNTATVEYEMVRYIAPDFKPKWNHEASKYRKQYDQWRANESPAVDGMPLEELPGIDMSTVRAIKDANIYTVEQLAEASDAALERIRGPAREWQSRAKLYLDKAEKGSISSIIKENADLKRRLAALEKVAAADIAKQNGIGFSDRRGRRKNLAELGGDEPDPQVTIPEDEEQGV